MADVKRCVQCGLLKNADMFRKYTYSRQHGTEGRYRICKACEATNAAYRRAKQLIQTQVPDTLEAALRVEQARETIVKTERLYDVLRSRGLRVPTDKTPPQSNTHANIDTLLAFYAADAPATLTAIAAPIDIPDELDHWLNVDTQEWLDSAISPEYLQETVYESLKAKYRPQTGIDKNTYLPIYDDTYRSILNQILRRFDDYEEECSVAEEQGE